MEAIACDVLVIGSRAAGLTTAITAHHFGADVLVVAHPEIGFVANLLPLQFIPPARKKFRKNAPLHTGTARPMDCSMYHPQFLLLRQGNLKWMASALLREHLK